MAILQQTQSGILDLPPILIIYGDGGLGKDTFASQFPSPYFIDVEGGTTKLNVARGPKPSKYDEVPAVIEELASSKHDYKTVVLSGLDALESLLFEKICAEDAKAVKSIVQAAGGYGNGYKVAIEHWNKLIQSLYNLRAAKKMNIVIVLHALCYNYNDPTTATGYDRFRFKLYEGSKESAAKLWFDSADIVLFAKKKIYQAGENRGLDDGKHYIYTQGRAAWDAKSRVALPFEMELDGVKFLAELQRKPANAKEVYDDLIKLAATIKEPAMRDKVNMAAATYANSVNDLNGLREQVKTLLKGA